MSTEVGVYLNPQWLQAVTITLEDIKSLHEALYGIGWVVSEDGTQVSIDTLYESVSLQSLIETIVRLGYTYKLSGSILIFSKATTEQRYTTEVSAKHFWRSKLKGILN